jgi:hypothetical protein
VHILSAKQRAGGEWGWRESGQAGKTCLYVSVTHFTLHFCLVESQFIMCVQSSAVLNIIIRVVIIF